MASKIARYKKPKHVVFVDALPKTDDGAVDREKSKRIMGRNISALKYELRGSGFKFADLRQFDQIVENLP